MYKLIGTKKEMTQSFGKDWKQSAISFVEVGQNVVARKTKTRVWVGFGKKRNPSKALVGTYRTLGYVPRSVIETSSEDYSGKNVRDSIWKPELLGSKVDIIGISKGKGFAGGHKKFDIKGGPSTRGQSTTQRKIGSVGSQTPGRVYKGVKMPGHLGQKRVTVKNLTIAYANEKAGIIGIKGHIPGGRNSLITIVVKEFGKLEEHGDKKQETGEKKTEAKSEKTDTKSQKSNPSSQDSKKL